ncbi:MAG: mechanosensitive ion channel [Nannocystaceae bacterium]|nr:mechanosensitive ion channel [bacterium]
MNARSRHFATVPTALFTLFTPALALAAPAAADGGPMGQLGIMADNPAVQLGARVLLAILLFIAGWIVAKMISYAVFQLLSRTDLDNKVAEKLGISLLLGERKKTEDGEGTVERFVAQAVYYVVMLLVVVGVLEFAGLSQVAGPLERLVDTVVQALPLIGKAALILIVAYVAGRILAKVASTALDGLKFDDRFAELAEAGQQKPAFSATVAKVIFWLVMLVGIAGAFEALEITPIAGPLHGAIDHVVGVLPRVAFAALLLLVGWFGGRIARAILRKVLQGLGFDSLAQKAQLDRVTGNTSPSEVVATAAMVFIVVQASIAALNELGLTTLSEPLTDMMGQFWNLLPKLAVGVVIVVVAAFVGQLLRRLVATALRNVGLDRFMANIGFKKLSERDDRISEYSEAVGLAVQVGVVLLGVAQALSTLELATWASYVSAFLGYIVKNVAVATFVVAVGFAIGNYVRDLIQARGDDEASRWLGEFARYAVLVFAFTMAVRQLDVAEDFVLLTFGLMFGALCLGAALAFGLGGREVAGDIVKRRYDEARRQMDSGGSSSGGGTPSAKETGGVPVSSPRAPTVPVQTTVVPDPSKDA